MNRAAVQGIGREVYTRSKEGSTFPADLGVREFSHLKPCIGILRETTRRKRMEREAARIALLQLQRIGQDRHDSVGQELTVLKLMVDELPEVFRPDPQHAGDLVERMAEGLQRWQQQLRDGKPPTYLSATVGILPKARLGSYVCNEKSEHLVGKGCPYCAIRVVCGNARLQGSKKRCLSSPLVPR